MDEYIGQRLRHRPPPVATPIEVFSHIEPSACGRGKSAATRIARGGDQPPRDQSPDRKRVARAVALAGVNRNAVPSYSPGLPYSATLGNGRRKRPFTPTGLRRGGGTVGRGRRNAVGVGAFAGHAIPG